MKPKRPFAYPANLSDTEKTHLMKQELRSSLLYWSLKRTIKGELIKSKYSLNDIKSLIPKILDQHNLKVKLKNEIYRLHQEALKRQYDTVGSGMSEVDSASGSSTLSGEAFAYSHNGSSLLDPSQLVPPTPHLDEPLDVVDQVRKNWSLFLKDQIMSISHQLKVPLYVPQKKENSRRPLQRASVLTADGSVVQASSHAATASTKRKIKKGSKGVKKADDDSAPDDTDDDLPKYTGVYGPSKLFETCVNIHNSNHERTFSTNIVGWGLIKLELEPLSIKDLQQRFSDLDPMNRQVGLDDQSKEWFSNDAINTAKRLSSGGYIPVLSKVARRGIPSTQRGKIWKQLLGVTGSSKQKAYFDMLLHQWNSSLMLIDDMVINDVKRTSDDENYFVFEDVILTVMQAFSRDAYIAEAASLKPVPLFGVDKLGKKRSCYPPNGVVPFEGLSLLVAPFTYIFSNPVDTYFAFRGMYIKYFCRLHVISSKPQSLIPLCKQFEYMLQNMHPHLYYHLLELNIHPLDIAVNWIFHAFAGYLQVDQLLLLWDRVIGFSDLNLLPVLSVSIFLFRAKPVMQTTSQQEIFDIFSDFSTIEIIPLLQAFVFKQELMGFSSY